MKKLSSIVLYALPVVLMIGLIPLVKNDYMLAFVYLLFIGGLFVVKKEENDSLAFIFGFVGITISEYFFVSTGVETFLRVSLFGLMPI